MFFVYDPEILPTSPTSPTPQPSSLAIHMGVGFSV